MNRRADTRTDTATELLDVLIIGAGFSGLGAAIQAQKQGCRRIAILEKGPDVGGGVAREHLSGGGLRRAVASVLLLFLQEGDLFASLSAPAGNPRVHASLRTPF